MPNNTEVEIIKKQFKNNKSPGIDDVTAETCRYGEDKLAGKMTWIQDIMLVEWTEAKPYPNKKGVKLVCDK